jgi:hypothetical protein
MAGDGEDRRKSDRPHRTRAPFQRQRRLQRAQAGRRLASSSPPPSAIDELRVRVDAYLEAELAETRGPTVDQ